MIPTTPEYAKTFFREIAGRHKDKTNIIYDIANEPNYTPWSEIKRYAEEVIPVIRQQDSDSLVLIGTHGWSTFGHSDGKPRNEVIDNPVRASNIMYTFHFYAGTHREDYLDTLNWVSDRVPVFVTELAPRTRPVRARTTSRCHSATST